MKKMHVTTEASSMPAERRGGSAADTLFASLYNELHRLARREVARRRGAAGLGVTTVLHEAYLAMAGRAETTFPDRPRFMTYAARVMRGLIIDDARARASQKRGGGVHLTTLPIDLIASLPDSEALVRIGDSLEALTAHDPELAEIVDLKFFCGFSLSEIADMRGLSERTARRNWRKARLYLHRLIAGDAVPLNGVA